jgi:hypothetical protein
MSDGFAGGDLAAHLEELEQMLLDHASRKDAGLIRRLLAEEFVEFGASGRTFTRDAIVHELADEQQTVRMLSDFVVRSADAHSALVTYTVSATNADGEVRRSRRSSTWVWRDGRWQMLFHQGTRIE